MANSTMHHAKAIVTQSFSDLCAGFHHTPFGQSSPVCVSKCMVSSLGKSGGGEMGDLPQPPAGVKGEHDQQPGGQQQKNVVEESLSKRYCCGRGGRTRRLVHDVLRLTEAT